MKKEASAGFGPLAIVGMACRFPKSGDTGEYWGNILNGADCIGEIPETHWRVADYYSEDPKAPDKTYAKRGGFIPPMDIDPMELGIPPTALEATDSSQLLGLVVAKEALRDAGYGDGREFNRERVSVILGVTGTLELVIPLGARLGHPLWRRALAEAGIEQDVADAVIDKISAGYVPWQEQSFPGLLGNVVAGRIANHLDLGGTNCVADAACASALSALNLAAMELHTGKADMVLTGGIDTFNDIFMYMCFSKTPALSPTGDARPFDRDGDGTILGEGLGVVVLKRLADAERDGDRIYAVLRGIGTSSDGRGSAIYAPSARGQERALRRAYRQAEFEPATVDLIEGHGTGTRVGDATEVRALTEVFGEDAKRKSRCALGSVKSQIGHTKAAAGVAGLIKAALALDRKVIPPTIKVRQPLPILEKEAPFYLNDQARPWMPGGDHPRRAGVSAFGFGGSNYHCLLEEYNAEKTAVDWDGQVQIVALSGAGREDLDRQLANLEKLDDWRDLARFAARSRLDFSPKHAHRLMILVEKDRTDPKKAVSHARSMLAKYGRQKHWSAPEGIYYGSGPTDGRLGVLFPGQGSQYTGMLRGLACRFPQIQKVLADVDAAFARCSEREEPRLTDIIYPKIWPSSDKEAEKALRQTQNAQPAIGAVSIGALKVLNHFGIRPQAAAGHSYGEITALCASERFDTQALYLLSRLRGQLMASGEDESGAMLAVRARVGDVESLVRENGLDLVLANKNAPDQIVLSGPAREIDRAVSLLEDRQISNKRLPVAAAFHSTLVAKAEKPFFAELQNIDFPKARIPVYSNTTGKPYPEDAQQAKSLLATQLTQPVEFIEEIRNMYDDGIRVFLEVGPGARLTGLVKSILSDRDAHAMAVDASSGKRPGTFDLGRVLAQLAALGHDVDLKPWEDSERSATEAPARKGMSVTLTGANYLSPQTKARAEKTISLKRKGSVTQAKSESLSVPETSLPPNRPTAEAEPNARPGISAPGQDRTAGRPDLLAQALAETDRHLQTLSEMQRQTADLHRQFLDGQESARKSWQQLMERQQLLYERAFGGAGQPVAPPFPVAGERPFPAPADLPKTENHAPPSVPSMGPRPVPDQAPVPRPSIRARSAEPGPSTGASEALLRVVSEKTGYPVETLELEMKLEADLGIDSIKRVEILSAFQERWPGAPEVKPEDMGRFRSLGDIVEMLGESGSTETPQPEPSFPGEELTRKLVAVVAEKTGYPEDSLELAMSLEGDLGIDSIKRVEILSSLQEAVPGLPAVEPDRMGALQTLGDIVAYLSDTAPRPTPATVPVTAREQRPEPSLLLRIVAEKTGYPPDMLEPEMSLEADLGIDSIKKVEIFSALQEARGDLSELKPDRMAEFRTLAHIAAYLEEKPGSRQAVSTQGPDAASIQERLLAVVAEKTGYPQDMLAPQMSLEADLGIDSIKKVEILSALQEAIPTLPEVKPDRMAEIRTLEEIAAFFSSPEPASKTAAVRAKEPVAETETRKATAAPAVLERSVLSSVAWEPAGPALNLGENAEFRITDDGSEWAAAVIGAFRKRGISVTSLTPESEPDHAPRTIAGLIILAPEDQAERPFLKWAFGLAREHASQLRETGKSSGALFATVSRFDGAFGLAEPGRDRNPTWGGLAGLAKTAGCEWPEVVCRAFDVTPSEEVTVLAERLADAVLTNGPTELAVGETEYRELTLEPLASLEPAALPPLSPGDAVIVTGGARGVTAEAALALAECYRPTLVLWGRSPLPRGDEPEWLRSLSEPTQIKKALAARSGKKTPKKIETEFRRITAEREVAANLERIRAAGVEVRYRSVDLRDPQAVLAALAQAREEVGPVRGLIHGAGVLADKLIVEKTEAQFDAVYETKIPGLRALLQALNEDELKVLALFSSSTARFGRKGQVDYAMANEALNKIAAAEASARPGCRVVSLNWGPWAGGMVTPGLEQIFAAEGIGLIPLHEGAACLVEACGASPGAAVEIVVLANTAPKLPRKVRESALQPSSDDGHPDGHPEGIAERLAFEMALSVGDHPILKSHVIDGKAVLPTVLMIEWLAHAAIHQNPGLKFHGFNDLRIFKGVVLEDETAVDLRFYAGKALSRDGFFLVPTEIRGRTGRLHAGAEIVLAERLPDTPQPNIERPRQEYGGSAEEIYSRFFHGPDFRGIDSVSALDGQGVHALVNAAPRPRAWIREPMRANWLSDPLALDCALQLMILWCLERHGRPSMPASIRSYRQYGKFSDAGTAQTVRAGAVRGAMAEADIELADRESGRLVAVVEGYECVMDPQLEARFRNNALSTAAVN